MYDRYRACLSRAITAILAMWLVIGSVCADTIGTVNPATLSAQINTDAAPLILDVRRSDEFTAGHIPGAINIPHTELEERLEELAQYKNKPVVVHCESGRRAALATTVLTRAGFSNVANLEGHMAGWRRDGLPVETSSNR